MRSGSLLLPCWMLDGSFCARGRISSGDRISGPACRRGRGGGGRCLCRLRPVVMGLVRGIESLRVRGSNLLCRGTRGRRTSLLDLRYGVQSVVAGRDMLGHGTAPRRDDVASQALTVEPALNFPIASAKNGLWTRSFSCANKVVCSSPFPTTNSTIGDFR